MTLAIFILWHPMAFQFFKYINSCIMRKSVPNSIYSVHQTQKTTPFDRVVSFFDGEGGFERPLRKHAGGMFLRPWENPCAPGRIRMDVDGCA